MIQGSPEWLAARAGHATASCFAKVMATVKVGEASMRRDYRWQLVTERLTGQPVESYTNTAMQWGKDHEAEARMAYEAQEGEFVDEVGFLLHPEVQWCGASPDGFVGDVGGVEIKCPFNSMVHVQTIEGGMPAEHRAQVQGSMWVTGRTFWDFISYDPRMPEKLQLYVERIPRDDAYIAKLAESVKAFLAEVDTMHHRLMARAA
jgi:putative phage-type endonuclease